MGHTSTKQTIQKAVTQLFIMTRKTRFEIFTINLGLLALAIVFAGLFAGLAWWYHVHHCQYKTWLALICATVVVSSHIGWMFVSPWWRRKVKKHLRHLVRLWRKHTDPNGVSISCRISRWIHDARSAVDDDWRRLTARPQAEMQPTIPGWEPGPRPRI